MANKKGSDSRSSGTKKTTVFPVKSAKTRPPVSSKTRDIQGGEKLRPPVGPKTKK